ncbi:ShlB/FhaC/HecB family hemolysin secretion/activation protein [Xanthomonas theicola]|nr:ShlB/FhaC/HecB family hemolysin secretion/activation protein [Xanthomonas theicola]
MSLASLVHAQVPPSAGDIQRQIRQDARTPAVAPPPATPPAAPVDRSGPQVTVRGVAIEGAALIPSAELSGRLAPCIGRSMSLGELQAAAQTLVEAYRERGWFARVQLPEQDVSDGIVRIRIVEGRLGRIDLQPASTRANAAYVAGVAGRRLRTGQPYSLAALERGLLLANDLPGIRADGTLRAGREVGTSDLALQVADGPYLSGVLGANNYGNRFTGRVQASANLFLNDLSGYGDRLQFFALRAERLKYLEADQSLPIGHDGLRANVGYSEVHYRLGREFADLDSKGATRRVSAGLDYPLVRGSRRNLWLSLDLGRTREQDQTLGVVLRRRQLNTATVALRGDARDDRDGGGLTSGRVALTLGQADLRLAGGRAQDAASAGIDGGFAYLTLDLRRDQLLAPSLYLRTSLAGHLAFDNLDASQEFALGGPYGVRGYPGNESRGDGGAVLQVELHSLLPWAGVPGLDGYVFVDSGRVRQHHRTWPGWEAADSGRNTYPLYSAGLGVSWTHPSGLTINGVLASPLGSNPGSAIRDRDQDGSGTGPRFWLTLNQAF